MQRDLIGVSSVRGPVAQSVEHRTENPSVGSSILPWPTMKIKGLRVLKVDSWPLFFCYCAKFVLTPFLLILSITCIPDLRLSTLWWL